MRYTRIDTDRSTGDSGVKLQDLEWLAGISIHPT